MSPQHQAYLNGLSGVSSSIDAICVLAAVLSMTNARLTAEQLALFLNTFGFHTKDGKPYQGKRGTFATIDRAQAAALRWGYPDLAAAIADAYVKADGMHAFD